MRFGIIEVTREVLSEILCLKKKIFHKHYERIIELPDDIQIVGIEDHPSTNSIYIVVSGSGAPLEEISEAGIIPRISVVMKEKPISRVFCEMENPDYYPCKHNQNGICTLEITHIRDTDGGGLLSIECTDYEEKGK
jgi:hypothetical protein